MAYKGYSQSKSAWQKENCINPRCRKKALYEWVYGKSCIRYCGNEDCKRFAVLLAVDFESLPAQP